jgi:hypothetical protein
VLGSLLEGSQLGHDHLDGDLHVNVHLEVGRHLEDMHLEGGDMRREGEHVQVDMLREGDMRREEDMHREVEHAQVDVRHGEDMHQVGVDKHLVEEDMHQVEDNHLEVEDNLELDSLEVGETFIWPFCSYFTLMANRN